MWQNPLRHCTVLTKVSEEFAPHYMAEIRHDMRQTTLTSGKGHRATAPCPILRYRPRQHIQCAAPAYHYPAPLNSPQRGSEVAPVPQKTMPYLAAYCEIPRGIKTPNYNLTYQQSRSWHCLSSGPASSPTGTTQQLAVLTTLISLVLHHRYQLAERR